MCLSLTNLSVDVKLLDLPTANCICTGYSTKYTFETKLLSPTTLISLPDNWLQELYKLSNKIPLRAPLCFYSGSIGWFRETNSRLGELYTERIVP